MVNTEMLNARINNSGFKKEYISDQLGISPTSLRNKMKNRTKFNASEIEKLIRMLSIDASEVYSMFFTELVSKTATNEEEPL